MSLCRLPGRARIGLAAGLVVACLACTAGADDVPLVTLLPGVMPLDGGSGDAPAVEQRLDGPLPASKTFRVQVPVGEGVRASGVLHVWPAVVQACDAKDDPPGFGPQTYALGMQLGPTPQGQALGARVPPLQIGQPFCLLARVQVDLTRAQLGRMVADVASALGDRFERKYLAVGEQAYPAADELRPELAAAFAQEIERQTQVPTDAKGVRQAAWLAADGFLASKGHLELRIRATDYRRLADRQAEMEAELEATKKALTTRPPLPALSSPVVFYDGVLIAVLDLLQADVKLATLDKAVAQLEARAEDKEAAWAKAWHAEVSKIAAELKTTAASEKGIFLSTAAADLTGLVRENKIPPPACLDMWDAEQGKLVCLSSFQRDPVFFDASFAKTVAAQVDDLASDWTGEAAGQYRGWLKDLARVIELSQERGNGAKRVERVAKRLADSHVQARRDFEAAFAAAPVVEALAADLKVVGVQVAGQGSAPDKGNYASVDLGIGLGWPVKGEADGPTFLPTIGLNIYLAPVDRVVPLDQLVGDEYDTWLQRLSLTVGISLTEPGVRGRQVKPMLLERYPFVALGYRTSHFMRVVLGVVLYQLHDANPASAAYELGTMPFLGVSLDADLVHLFTEAVQ